MQESFEKISGSKEKLHSLEQALAAIYFMVPLRAI
jgi:hypothetical protein